jgi:hypothetical protein
MASAAVAYGRTIRPFPTQRLGDAVFYVEADAHAITQHIHRLLVHPPGTPESWCQELQKLQGLIGSLEERCQELRPVISEMYDDADRAFDVAVRAMTAMLRGLQVAGEPPDVGSDGGAPVELAA